MAARAGHTSAGRLVRMLRAGRDRWRRLGSGHEPVYLIAPDGGTVHALYRWGVRTLPVERGEEGERPAVLRTVFDDLLRCHVSDALIRARLDDEKASPGAPQLALTATALRAWTARHPYDLLASRKKRRAAARR